MQSSPYINSNRTIGSFMLDVGIAMVPGFVVLSWLFGEGIFINLIYFTVCALISEAIILRIRKLPILLSLKDGSACITAAILALSLPTHISWGVALIGIACAIIIGKHLYGGLGNNLFNPAMLGYVVIAVSFPASIVSPVIGQDLSILQYLQSLFLSEPHVLSGATALETLHHNQGLLTWQELQTQQGVFQGDFASVGIEYVNLSFLIGGLYLIWRRVISYHAPLGMLLSMALISLLFYNDGGNYTSGGPVFQLFTGATMFGAFFIITDPASCTTSNRGKLIFGIGAGILIFIIRQWGTTYPDGVAFAVLLMNFAAPLIDKFTIPKSYGVKN